ncbi:substrate-binding domain-containing protein [Oryzomonas rubra]|uniref:Phosphate ABC transporter substrate-binding protein n=1 Tax=Oryzomonas rubra TaxID=2509454 RepID=A0A5A9X943_9BACT|nr:substrate-binding domain-containing protein [Oryzomonas rubra]KAA0888968.1 phosphate ABC transporter substrate-binding protein [Oryzomonas rubra]
MLRLGFVAGLFVVVLWTGISSGSSEELKIGAGDAAAENILKPIKEAFESANNVQLIVIESGAKVAFADLNRASLDAAAAGIGYPAWLELMKREGVEIEDPAVFQPVTIGKDHIVVITSKENPVKKLNAEQLRGIFSGEIENWNQVGGADMPIMVVWGSLMQDTNAMFLSAFLAGKPLVSDVLDATTAEDVRTNIAANPSAIGIGPAGALDDSVASPETPLLSRDITLISRANPPNALLKLLEFINKDGRKFIKATE